VEAAGRLSGITNPYQVMALFCNREMSKAVLGQTLTTDTEGSTGTYAAGKVQAEVRRDLLEADHQALAQTMRLQVLRPLVGFNFGWEQAVPGFSFIVQDAPDLKSDSEVCKNLAGIGVRIPVSYISEHFGIPLPKEGEETVGGAAPAQIPPSPPLSKGEDKMAARAVLPLRQGELELIPQDAAGIRAQREMENLTQAAISASSQAVAQMLAPVKAFIDRGASLEEIRDGLLAVYKDLPTGDLEELLYQAMVLANLRGRLEE